jgi:hypothetical protein
LSVVTLDLRKSLHYLYNPPAGRVEQIEVPAMKYVMVDGAGDPDGAPFQEAVEAIYSLAYTLKFRCKKVEKHDYNVMALEGLWWAKGKFAMAKRNSWLWTLMVVQPDFVDDKMFSEAFLEVREKKNPPGLARARLETFDEGLCVQTMHVGPYSTEPESVALLDAFAKEHGYRMVGKHHEVYLGDPRRAAPSKLRTIIRHPVAKAG